MLDCMHSPFTKVTYMLASPSPLPLWSRFSELSEVPSPWAAVLILPPEKLNSRLSHCDSLKLTQATEEGEMPGHPPPTLNKEIRWNTFPTLCPLRINWIPSRCLSPPPPFVHISCADSFRRHFLRRLFLQSHPPSLSLPPSLSQLE